MKAVGIKLLKNKLSEYIKLAREGEVILVTDRDEVVAEISRPRTPLSGYVSRWEVFLNEEERAGRVTRARRSESLAIAHLHDNPLPAVEVDLLRLLDESRADRA